MNRDRDKGKISKSTSTITDFLNPEKEYKARSHRHFLHFDLWNTGVGKMGRLKNHGI